MTEVAGAHAAAQVLTGGRHPIPDGAAAHLQADEAHGVCPNCETPLVGAFCYACGQKAHLHNRLRDLAHEALEGLYHLDGRLWRTLPILALNPGRLSRDWRAGKRTRYVSPLSAFLFAVFLLFLIPSVTGQHLVHVPTPQEAARREAALNAELPREDRATPNSRPGRLAARANEWFAQRFARGDYYTAKIESLAYKLSFLVVPLSMLILALLLVGRRGYSFYDHGVVALYGVGFFTYLITLATLISLAVQTVVRVPPEAVGRPLIVVGAVHAFFHLKGAYALGYWGALWRTVVLGLLSIFAFGGFMILITLLGFAS